MKSSLLNNHRLISKGTSLVEVMVSVLILSIGLLGIAAMQATALRNTQSGMERTQAVIQSYAILDALRTDTLNSRAALYTVDWTCAIPGSTTSPSLDMATWVASTMDKVSSDACGRISCTASICTIDVRWNDSRGTGGSASQTVTTVSRI
jgi:type IV pilus assembly protein PilV